MNLYLVDGDVGPSSFGVGLSRSALESTFSLWKGDRTPAYEKSRHTASGFAF
jgi:hypothetical protein